MTRLQRVARIQGDLARAAEAIQVAEAEVARARDNLSEACADLAALVEALESDPQGDAKV